MSYSRESKTNLNFQQVNKPSWICPNKVLQSWLICTVYHLLMKNNKVKGNGGFKEMVGLLTFFPWKWGGGEVIKEGGLIVDLQQLQQLYITPVILAVTFSKRRHIVSYWRCFTTQLKEGTLYCMHLLQNLIVRMRDWQTSGWHIIKGCVKRDNQSTTATRKNLGS